MKWSITRAAKEAGLSKSTVSRAIKSGKMSAVRQEDGSYLIDPSELFRVYPKGGAQPVAGAGNDTVRNPREEVPATPSAETEILRVKLAMTEAMLEREQETVADLRKRLDVATGRALELTKVAQPQNATAVESDRNTSQPPTKRGWWQRLRGL